MANFKDLDELLDDTLKLLIVGVTYVVPAPSAERGLYCQRVLAAGVSVAAGEEPTGPPPVLDDGQELDLYSRCLGTAYDQMVADNVSWPRIRHAGITAFLWIASGEDLAAAWWRGDPNALSPNREARRATSASTGAASKIRPRASTSGTKSRTTSGAPKPAKTAKSRGATS